jgi:hypothetical protein
MALIFSRLAHNFIKNGYYPTDEVTLGRILQALDVAGDQLRILDPCCGEGTALAEVKHHLGECGAGVQALGIEFDRERAWHAKQLLDRAVHCDFQDAHVSPRSIGLLFLNPPYGDVVSDKAAIAEPSAKRERLEKILYRRAVHWLQFGGVLVLIVPHYVLDAEFSALLSRHFDRLQVFMAPEKRFKQCVIFGVKRRADVPELSVQRLLESVGSGELPPELPETWVDVPYMVPRSLPEFSFQAIRIDAEQLANELERSPGHSLWPGFRRLFSAYSRGHRRPLRDLSDWHLALALAAGQISGVVESDSGRRLLVKGDTFKERDLAVTYEEKESGAVSEIRTFTDRFVPSIVAIDFTRGPNYGSIVQIR